MSYAGGTVCLMADLRTFPPGVPCWVDTEQPDVGAAAQFYGALFGWTFQDAIPAEAPGTYLIAALNGRPAAAIGPATGDTAAWNMYVAVDDADASARRVRDAGGSVTIEPAEAGPGGRLVGCADPRGASFRLWQPRARLGVQVANEPGSWNFNTLHTADPAAAQNFYPRVFGWEYDDFGLIRSPGYGQHLAATIDPTILERQSDAEAPPGFEDAVAWVATADDGVADHWDIAFTVADRDAATALAQRLGAEVLASQDTEWTRSSVIRDPQGAELVLSQYLG